MAHAQNRVFAPSSQQVRHLNLHEYQSKELMAKHGVNTQKFRVADSASAAEAAARELSTAARPGTARSARASPHLTARRLTFTRCTRGLPADVKEIVLKAQIHAGGRGKGHFTSGLQGGVHLTEEYGGRAKAVHRSMTSFSCGTDRRAGAAVPRPCRRQPQEGR